MKLVFSLVLLVLCFGCTPLNSSAQSMSHDEEIVRNTYAKLSFMCETTTITEAAMHSPTGASLLPQFVVEHITTGDIVNIANTPLSHYVSTPTDNTEILAVDLVTRQHSQVERGIHSTWVEGSVHLQKADPSEYPDGAPIADLLKLASNPYTRYAAFTVDTILPSRESTRHQALFLFGKDASGKEVVMPLDRYVRGLADVLRPADLRQLIHSPIRENADFSSWLLAHAMSESSCKAAQGDTCCANGLCGFSARVMEEVK